MAFGDKLKSIFGIDIDLSGLKTFRFVGNGNRASLINVEKKTININVDAKELQDPEKRRLLQDAIHSIVNEEKLPLLQDQANKTVNEIAQGDVYTPIYDFFKDKLPNNDASILRASLYIRRLHDEGASIDKLKGDIVMRHGQHGANICNLSTAGYFESHFKPMYEELSARPDFTIGMFTSSYSAIVDNAPFALFVKRAQSIESLKAATIEQMTYNRSYGIRQLTIHAIGDDNIKKVNNLLKDDEVKAFFIAEPDITIQGTVISVSLHYYDQKGGV